MSELRDSQPSVFEVFEETTIGLDIRGAFSVAKRAEQHINNESLSQKEVDKLIHQLDTELWDTHLDSIMLVIGSLYKATIANRADGQQVIVMEDEAAHYDEQMLSKGFYFKKDTIQSDDGESIASYKTAGLYFVDAKGHHYFGALADIEVIPLTDEHLAEERLQRYFPDDIRSIESGIAEHPDEEGFVTETMQWVSIEAEVHDELKRQYISDLESYINARVYMDKELPYRLRMVGECTQLLDDGSEVTLNVHDYCAYVQPERIRVMSTADQPGVFHLELEYYEYSRSQDGARIHLRAAGDRINRFESLRRHTQDDIGNL